jgi:NADPH-dependent 2,4-dienoyl-CoA reductase/sulfur reductase-like enzyme
VIGEDLQNVQRKIFGDKTITAESEFRDPNALNRFDQWQSHCDIVIIGGGVVGASIAYWIQQRVPKAVNIVVLEKDPTVSTNKFIAL